MSSYNNFGVTTQDVVDLYPNVNASDMGGDTVIEDAIGRSVRRIVSLLPMNVSEILNNRVTQEQLAGPAFGGEGPTFQLGLGPIADADKEKILIYRQSGNTDGSKRACPTIANQEGTLGGTGNQTLTITGSQTTLLENEYLYITYVIDPSDPTFELESYADYVVYATAYELGSKLFDQETDSWKLVDEYKEIAAAYLTSLEAGGFVDTSIRALEFCNEIDPAGAEIVSVKKYRA